MDDLKVTKGTFIKSEEKVDKMMLNLFIALLPIIAFTFYKNGIKPYLAGNTNIYGMLYPLIFILVGVITTTITEALYLLIIKKEKGKNFTKALIDSYCFFPGLFMTLVLPINTPLWIVIYGGLFASIIGKLVFGGFGNNIFNPALIGRLAIMTTFASIIASNGGYLNPSELDAVTKATPLTNAAITSGIGTYETLVAPYGSLWDFFLGNIPGALGETSALLCLVSFIYLTATKTIKWKIPVVYVATVFFMTYLIGGYHEYGLWYPLFQIMSGGLLFGAVFMATDPVTSPTTPIGQILYGLFLGILTVTFRYMTSMPEGVLVSILFMNMFVFIIDRIGSKARFKFSKSFIPFIVAWCLILGIGFYIGSTIGETTDVDPDYTIISKETSGNKTTYVATQKGYASNIKGEIVITDGKITSFKILDQNDSFFVKVEQANYTSKFINKDNVTDIDTVTGATISSTALKKMAANTLLDYKKGSEDIKGNDEDIKPVSDFNIISKDTIDNTVTYVATQKGFSSLLKAQVIIVDGVVTEYTILEQKDSYYGMVESNNYVNTLISNQDNLEEVDTVSGATYTSTGLKKLLINVLADYRGEANNE